MVLFSVGNCSAKGNIEPVLPIQPQQANFIQESMQLAEESNIIENAAANVNFETMTSANENQQMEPASYNGGEGACPAGDNIAATPEAAAPAVSAIPVMDAGLIEYLKNETNCFENHQGLMGTNFSMEY